MNFADATTTSPPATRSAKGSDRDEPDRPVRDGSKPAGRIIVATLNRLSGATGVHTHTRSLVGGLHAEGFSCDVVTPFSGSRLWQPIFAVRPLILKRIQPTWGTLWYRHWHMTALRVNLRRAVRGGSVSHIIAQCPPSARVAMDVLGELQLRDRVLVTMVCHFNRSEADEYRDQRSLNGAAYERVKTEEESAIRAVDRVVYVSSWAQQLVEHERGLHTKASSVIWNGISERSPMQTPLSRKSMGVAENDLVLMNVGTLEPRKDQLGLVRLFAIIAKDFPNAKLVLIGDGPDRARIESSARHLGIADSVILLGHRGDVPALLQTADVYVHFASAENCPIALLEASRAGLPWAANPAAGVQELLAPLGGVALDAESAERSLIALRPLLNDADYRRTIGEQNRIRFIQTFTQTAMVRAYIRELNLVTIGGAA